ncbi:TIGR01458 family HAD-type hydrolase [Marinimicrobium agarilyticum]|uniref:TIGR01458 family HAD-type hydrolase n=1 Tax=Marinimicrobium agarilyticum TaxID=306546 RepID=UPI000407B241|nr:TIGR01458 family HAD-type hydrolase [Marinimicrobium agarilyticum]
MTTPVKALFIDLSGVLYDGKDVIPGALEAMSHARQKGLTLRFVTNTATQSRETILENLATMGFSVEPEELFTAPDAALSYLQAQNLRPYALVHPSIKPMFDAQAEEEPNCVVLGDAREDLNYANLNQAFRYALEHRTLIAIGDNKYFSDGDQLCLDAGPFVRAIAWASDVEPVIMGKPSSAFFNQVVASTDVTAEQCMMIGDDVFGDIEGALNAGLQARLVKTGKYQTGDENRIAPWVKTLKSIAELDKLL